jgi:hypothetical protein
VDTKVVDRPVQLPVAARRDAQRREREAEERAQDGVGRPESPLERLRRRTDLGAEQRAVDDPQRELADLVGDVQDLGGTPLPALEHPHRLVGHVAREVGDRARGEVRSHHAPLSAPQIHVGVGYQSLPKHRPDHPEEHRVLVVVLAVLDQDVPDVVRVVDQHDGNAQRPEPEDVAVPVETGSQEAELVLAEGQHPAEAVPAPDRRDLPGTGRPVHGGRGRV